MCSIEERVYRVNITIETDEDDLMGGHTLQNGNIIFQRRSCYQGDEKRAVLLLDEVDLGSNKLMCLQSVLEGKGYLIKKTGEWVNLLMVLQFLQLLILKVKVQKMASSSGLKS